MSGSQSRRAQPEEIAANKARQRELDWDETRRPAWIAWLGMACAVALIIAMVVMSQSDRTSKPMHVNGDQLGPFYMSDAAYAKHSRKLLDDMTGEQPRWALVSPKKSLNSQQLAGALRVDDLNKLRVSTLLVGPATQLRIAEPAAGLRRVDVFELAAEKIKDKPVTFDGAVVYAAPEELRQIAGHSEIMAVEPAPVDAVYGRIGIRAVNTDG